ncbi:hypothetical protein EsH8_IX_000547 [Colletotrichum jinshuiense]
MKFTTTAITAILAVISGAQAAPVAMPVSAPAPQGEGIPFIGSQTLCQHRTLPGYVAQSYSVMAASGVTDVPAVCGGLWDNLKRFVPCAVPVDATCREGEQPGSLIWHFKASTGCNAGMIGSAWWEATRNEFGGLQCKDVNKLSFQ